MILNYSNAGLSLNPKLNFLPTFIQNFLYQEQGHTFSEENQEQEQGHTFSEENQ